MTPENMRARSEALVIAMLGAATAPKWWASPNRAFELKTPEQMWTIDPDRVYAYLMHHSDYTI